MRDLLYWRLAEIVKNNVADRKKKEALLDDLQVLFNVTPGQESVFAAKLLEKYQLKDMEEAKIKIVDRINFKYNPCRNPVERWADLQAKYLKYCYFNQQIRNNLDTMEKIYRLENIKTERLRQLADKLEEEQGELKKAVDDYKEEMDTARFRVDKSTNLQEKWHETTGMLDEKTRKLEEIEDVIRRINETDRQIRFNKGWAVRRDFKEWEKIGRNNKETWRSLEVKDYSMSRSR